MLTDIPNPVIHTPTNCLVVGPTHSGKTTFIRKLLENRHTVFKDGEGRVPNQIHYLYGSQWQPVFTEMQQELPITFIQGFPKDVESKLDTHGEPGIVVIEDMHSLLETSQEAFDFATKKTHHMGKATIIVLHSLFGRERLRNLRENSEVLFLFGFRNETSRINLFLGRYETGQRREALCKWYNKVTESVGDYICINTSLRVEDSRLRYTTNFIGVEAEGKALRFFQLP